MAIAILRMAIAISCHFKMAIAILKWQKMATNGNKWQLMAIAILRMAIIIVVGALEKQICNAL